MFLFIFFGLDEVGLEMVELLGHFLVLAVLTQLVSFIFHLVFQLFYGLVALFYLLLGFLDLLLRQQLVFLLPQLTLSPRKLLKLPIHILNHRLVVLLLFLQHPYFILHCI